MTAPEDGPSMCRRCGGPLRGGEPRGGHCLACLLEPALESEAGTPINLERFDHYEVATGPEGAPLELGRGAMGVTYQAINVTLGHAVALKVIDARLAAHPQARERFLREARAAARLRHPNVASVFYYGVRKTDGQCFYAMELVEGETLEARLHRDGPVPAPVALEMTFQVARALAAAEAQGLVHRDLKPSNLMLAKGAEFTVKVIDFGLAKAISTSQLDPAISTPGTFIGTPHFASPEQCAGTGADIRSDLYSIGITLWQMLTGRVPFDGTALEVISQHLYAPLPLHHLGSLSRPVVALIEALLEKDPRSRPQDSREFQTLLCAVKTALEAESTINLSDIQKTTRRRKSAAAREKKRFFVVAVLPFANVGDEKENAFLSDGLTGELIFQLSKVSKLQVISQGSVMHYRSVPDAKRRPLREIGVELKATHILEGSVQRVKSRLKVISALYDARTERRLWVESFDWETKDLFDVQRDAANRIAAALRVNLSVDKWGSTKQKPPNFSSAHALYLRGLGSYEKHRRADNDKAIDLFRQALTQDPHFVLALTGLANAYVERVSRYEGESFWADLAIEFCQRAIMLNPAQSQGHVALARCFEVKKLGDQMQAPVHQALALAPHDLHANRMHALMLANAGRSEDIYPALQRCFTINPNDRWVAVELAAFCRTIGANARAATWMRRALQVEDDLDTRQMLEHEFLVLQGDYASALAGLRQLPRGLKGHYYTRSELIFLCSICLGDWPTVIGLADAFLKEHCDHAFSLLYKALALRESGHGAEARAAAFQGIAVAQSRLVRGQHRVGSHWRMAFGCRLLDRDPEAYEHLRTFPLASYLLPLLGRGDPWIRLFEADVEFQSILGAMNSKHRRLRATIDQAEANDGKQAP